jgi:uncharacterized LabA/DUF88 family protein
MARVAVFIDWQNTYKTAREAFGWDGFPNEYGNYSPLRVARLLAAGNERERSGELMRVSIHRGLPSQRHDPAGYAANRRQSAAWIRESPDLVIPRLRPLRYARDPDEPPREKGIDVELAVAAVECVFSEGCDVAVIFSHDTDLVPAVELIARLRGNAAVETASWGSDRSNRRLRIQRAIHHHVVSYEQFRQVETRVNYAHEL